MTPVLLGRWQTRLFLLATVGIVIALPVGLVIKNIAMPLIALFYVFLFGIGWDALYQYILTYRWDRDWPTSFQVAAGVVEGIVLWILIQTGVLPGLPRTLLFLVYLIQYGLTWLCMFLITQGPLRTFFPKWRYQGGQWFVPSSKKKPLPSVQQPSSQQPIAVQPPIVSQPIVMQFPIQSQPVAMSPLSQRAASLQGAPLFACECGYTSDRPPGKFCPQCGRPQKNMATGQRTS